MSALPLPALHASHGGSWLRDGNAATRTVSKGEAMMAAADTPLLILNAPLLATRLGYPDLSGLDLLELFAFVHPARFVVPTPKGLAHALDLTEPDGEPDVPRLLQEAAGRLLETCESPDWQEREGAWTSLQSLVRMRWPWATLLGTRIAKPQRAERWLFSRLPEWEETADQPQPRQVELSEADVLQQLQTLTGAKAEQREGQRAYAAQSAAAFSPRKASGQPNVLLAQAGTGIGKTLGYLAPASLWSALSGGTVWVSTYTKALQRQLRQESRRAWPERRPDGSQPVVVRKGRENYLCLLNLEDALQGGFAGRAAILAQLVARWAAYTRDGDMIGGDLPGWLGTLFRQRGITALTDRRGECVYAGCPHYRKCFIERASRASAQADLVIGNHALVMVNAARGRDHAARPTRIVFDEGHHVFDAADSTFAAALSGSETIELRRWVIGPEKASRGRRRGLSARLADIVSYDEAGAKAIAAARAAAEALPGDGWMQRINEGAPSGPLEDLLASVRATVYARDESGGQEAGYGLETEAAGLDGTFIEVSQAAREALADLRQPLMRLGMRLEALLEDPPDWLDGQGRARIEGARHSLSWRIDLLSAWEALLERLGGPADPEYVDWLAVDRSEAREFDIGIHRHWLDPMKPFAKVVLEPAHGVVMTSATLRDGEDWGKAVARSGVEHIGVTPRLSAHSSPFDYAKQAEVLIVTDVPRGDIPALAAAYARLIEASHGGALGLFTAIRRLRAVHGRIADRLARTGLPLYAQHVDPIDTGTLVDIFRDDPAASLLGTDALRDGVDVPGDSLRLVVMEQVPWPRPTILHRARRLAGGGGSYDDGIIRARLAQAFGRLIRSRDDRGHFVVLSAAFPSRLLSAFPEGTPVLRLSLEEALHRVATNASEEAYRPDHAARP
ncbi:MULTISPECIES: ATP-dependent DNA helicase [Novosphingobium]|uniref:ATP-dependent DNA helicase DinG n=1 Tax=Novosphingobium pentaromativorans US6-1 TaxID=1088721 RepID=G6EIJ0_9SPHN|nr:MULTISPECIES: ATP-dependent DNA helicase [Novosphingobium]EHJ58932.1 ATP-dependent DNA helicase DinG [Novosphingobium pentaromativorans US6-1]CCA93540.1 ATP-dependent DNA helicase DinG [Novosphingobium sp. PP1Y]